MASSTSASSTTLLPKPAPVGLPSGHGMRLFWSGVVLIAALTAALGTWVVTQSDTDTVGSTTSVTGAMSPRAADHRDAQIMQSLQGASTRGLSPAAADYRDGQTLQAHDVDGPLSPNAADHQDRQQQFRSRVPQ